MYVAYIRKYILQRHFIPCHRKMVTAELSLQAKDTNRVDANRRITKNFSAEMSVIWMTIAGDTPIIPMMNKKNAISIQIHRRAQAFAK